MYIYIKIQQNTHPLEIRGRPKMSSPTRWGQEPIWFFVSCKWCPLKPMSTWPRSSSRPGVTQHCMCSIDRLLPLSISLLSSPLLSWGFLVMWSQRCCWYQWDTKLCELGAGIWWPWNSNPWLDNQTPHALSLSLFFLSNLCYTSCWAHPYSIWSLFPGGTCITIFSCL